MSEEAAIQQVLNRYTDGCNRQEWGQVMATFVEDGIWEALGEIQGHGPIQAAMAGFLRTMAYFVQINAPAVIVVAGDTATARSTIRECGKFADRNEALEVLGWYEDELVRSAAGWQFVRRRFHTIGMQRFALLPGPALG